jgi:hypothetical protein
MRGNPIRNSCTLSPSLGSGQTRFCDIFTDYLPLESSSLNGIYRSLSHSPRGYTILSRVPTMCKPYAQVERYSSNLRARRG